MSTSVVTGANRGIGLEIARRLHERGEVIATARRPEEAAELRDLGVRVEALDVADPASIEAFGRRLAGEAVDLLVNNAGVYPTGSKALDQVDPEDLVLAFRVNSIAPLLVTRAVLPCLLAGERRLVVHVTSEMGSIARASAAGAEGNYPYRASKAALNMIGVAMANELRRDGVTCVMMHPGWVRTDMGGREAALSPEASVGSMMEVWDRLGPGDSGRYLDFRGEHLPW